MERQDHAHTAVARPDRTHPRVARKYWGYDTLDDGQAVRERCGVLLEHCGLYERLTAEQNLDMFARFRHLDAGARRDRIQAVLTPLELWHRRTDVVGTWSRGMKQKLAIAPVFLDEPTAGLDALAALALRDDLARLAARDGATVFLTTHNLAEAERPCARVAIIRQGRIIGAGAPAEPRGTHASVEDAFVDLLEASS